MKRWIVHTKSVSFQVRWIFMSPLERYSYLWARTQRVCDLDYNVRNPTDS
jgi:hypothetical protein